MSDDKTNPLDQISNLSDDQKQDLTKRYPKQLNEVAQFLDRFQSDTSKAVQHLQKESKNIAKLNNAKSGKLALKLASRHETPQALGDTCQVLQEYAQQLNEIHQDHLKESNQTLDKLSDIKKRLDNNLSKHASYKNTDSIPTYSAEFEHHLNAKREQQPGQQPQIHEEPKNQ